MLQNSVKLLGLATTTLLLTLTPSLIPEMGSFSTLLQAQTVEKNIEELQLNQPITRQIKDKEIHSYLISLEEGEYIRLIVDQLSVDVVVKLLNPKGKQILWEDSMGRSPELLSTIAEITGDYILQIHRFGIDDPFGINDRTPKDALVRRIFD